MSSQDGWVTKISNRIPTNVLSLVFVLWVLYNYMPPSLSKPPLRGQYDSNITYTIATTVFFAPSIMLVLVIAICFYFLVSTLSTLYSRRESRKNYVNESIKPERVPKIIISNRGRIWGINECDVSCTIIAERLDVLMQLRLCIVPYFKDSQGELKELKVTFPDHFSGKTLRNLNPADIISDHFHLPIPKTAKDNHPFYFRVEIFFSIIIHGEEHKMNPFSYIWDNPDTDWWYEARVLGKNPLDKKP